MREAIKKMRYSWMKIWSSLQEIIERLLMRCWSGKIIEPEEKRRRTRNENVSLP